MKNNFLKFGMCILALGTVLCSGIIFQKNSYEIENNRSKNNSHDIFNENLSIVSDKRINSSNEDLINIDSFYISETNYKEDMDNIVMPYIESKMKYGYINGIDNTKLYYEIYNSDNPKGNIVISHGYTESLEKYHEIIYYFLNSGYNVFGIEHRGHGRSGSLGIADKSQIYVNSFSDYIEDLKIFMDEVVVPNCGGMKLYLYAHSMGGAIGSRFLEVYPQYFSKAVLNAPMMEVNTEGIPVLIAKAVVKASVILGYGGEYVIGKGPFSPSYSFDGVGTSSENRWKYIDELANENQEIQRGEASYKWTDEAFKVTKEITKKEVASKVTIPILLFQSGNDAYVNPGGQNKFAQYAQNCELIKIDNAKHEIYLEKDDIQKPYIEKVVSFYNS